MEDKVNKKKKESGWVYLNNRNKIELSKIIGKVTLIVERNEYLGRDKIRISRKKLHEIYDILENSFQRIKWKRSDN